MKQDSQKKTLKYTPAKLLSGLWDMLKQEIFSGLKTTLRVFPDYHVYILKTKKDPDSSSCFSRGGLMGFCWV